MARMENASTVTRRDTSLVTALSQERYSLTLISKKFLFALMLWLLTHIHIGLLIHSHPYWIVDLGVTEHVARDRVGFIKHRQIPKGSRGLFMGNGTSVQVQGIGTYKLELHGGRTLLLQDVLYASEVWQNLLSVVKCLKLGFNFNFHSTSCDFYLRTQVL